MMDQYTAPEMLRGAHHVGPEIDVWCAGVILFYMLTGEYPFEQQPLELPPQAREDALLRREQRHYQHGLPDAITPECRDLLDRLLAPTPSVRCTIEHIELHPWFRQGWDHAHPGSLDAQLAVMYAAFAHNEQLHPSPCEKSAQELDVLALQAVALMP